MDDGRFTIDDGRWTICDLRLAFRDFQLPKFRFQMFRFRILSFPLPICQQVVQNPIRADRAQAKDQRDHQVERQGRGDAVNIASMAAIT